LQSNKKLIDLSIILPCYQEAENLELLIPRIIQTLEVQNIEFEIIIVDTEKAMDETPSISQKFKTIYVNRAHGNSYGNAIRTGIATARGGNILFMDADGSHPPEFIPQLLEFSHEYDVVIASRYIASGGTKNSFALESMSRILNWSYAIVLNIPCKDVSNSFRVYKGDKLKSLSLNCDNFDIVEEILVKLVRKYNVIRFKEVPFVFEMRQFGKTKRNLFLFILTYIYTLMRLRLSK
jgi:dolichol-phosphate mannosyltransferase